MEIKGSYTQAMLRYNNAIKSDFGVNSIIQNKNQNEEVDSFKDVLENNLNKVNQKQIDADIMTNRFIAGDVENVEDVLIASEEARLYLELAVQVRNKLIEAYKEVNNMQI